jgi:hypothetical protein
VRALRIEDVGPWSDGGTVRMAGHLVVAYVDDEVGWEATPDWDSDPDRLGSRYEEGPETGPEGRALADAALARMLGEPEIMEVRASFYMGMTAMDGDLVADDGVSPEDEEALRAAAMEFIAGMSEEVPDASLVVESPPEPAEVPGGAAASAIGPWHQHPTTEGLTCRLLDGGVIAGVRDIGWRVFVSPKSIVDFASGPESGQRGRDLADEALALMMAGKPSEVSRLSAALAAAEARAERAEQALAMAEQIARDVVAERAAQEDATTHEESYHNYSGRLAAIEIAAAIAALRVRP